MAKRKSSTIKVKPRRIAKLDKEFDCPFCNNARAVKVELDRVRQVGSLSCRVCGAAFNRMINKHDEGIDVFGDWIDACVAANAQAAKEAEVKLQQGPGSQQRHSSFNHRTASTASAENGSDADIPQHVSSFRHAGSLPSETRLVKRSLPRSEPDEDEPFDGVEDTSGAEARHPVKRLKLSEERRRDSADDDDLESSNEENQEESQEDNAAVADTLEMYRQEAQNEDDGDDAGSLFQDDE